MERGVIPANKNYKTANPCIPSLADGNLQVVTENVPLFDGYCAVNSLGLGGYHVHTLLAANVEVRSIHYMASQQMRLCVYQGRTMKGVQQALKVKYGHVMASKLYSIDPYICEFHS